MEKIYILGDMHTVSAFRLAGVEGVVAASENAEAALDNLVRKRDAGIVLITNELARPMAGQIAQININLPGPVVIEIPGLDDTEGFRRSAMGYVAEALGISL